MSFLLLIVIRYLGEDKLPEVVGGMIGTITGSTVAFISWGHVFDLVWALAAAFLSGVFGVAGAHWWKKRLARKSIKKEVK
jgi:NAD(P)H-hydrate repair Nnr-like enzyme with NAD(P)H-hydrate dehydratase domain